MDNWFKVNLGDAMLANDTLADIKACLSTVYELQGRPEDMLAIYRHESADLHCNLVVYLTNKFQRAAMLESALGCPKPPLIDSGFLVGDSAQMNVGKN